MVPAARGKKKERQKIFYLEAEVHEKQSLQRNKSWFVPAREDKRVRWVVKEKDVRTEKGKRKKEIEQLFSGSRPLDGTETRSCDITGSPGGTEGKSTQTRDTPILKSEYKREKKNNCKRGA